MVFTKFVSIISSSGLTVISLWILGDVSPFNRSSPIVDLNHVVVRRREENIFENKMTDVIYDTNYFIRGYGSRGVHGYPQAPLNPRMPFTFLQKIPDFAPVMILKPKGMPGVFCFTVRL